MHANTCMHSNTVASAMNVHINSHIYSDLHFLRAIYFLLYLRANAIRLAPNWSIFSFSTGNPKKVISVAVWIHPGLGGGPPFVRV